MKRRQLLHALTLPFTVGASSWVRAQTPTPRVIRVSSPTLDDSSNRWMNALKETAERRSDGRLRIELFPGGRLGPIGAAVESVALGTTEVTIAAVGFFGGLEPRFRVLDMAGVFKDRAQGHRALLDPALLPWIADLGRQRGVEALFLYPASPLLLLARKPVLRLEDLEGLKIRPPGANPLHVEPLRRFGAQTVTLSLGESMPALQNRMIDGLMAGFSPMTRMRFFDISPHLTEVPGSYLMTGALANRAALSQLGPELEGIFREAVRSTAASVLEWADDDVRVSRAEWESRGGRVHMFSAADAKRYIDVAQETADKLSAGEAAFKADLLALRAVSSRHR